METTTMPLQAVWSTVLVDNGEQFATTCGVKLTFLFYVDSLD